MVDSVDADRSNPTTGLSEPLGVEDDPAPVAEVLAGFLVGRHGSFPGDVHGHRVFGRFDDHSEASEGF